MKGAALGVLLGLLVGAVNHWITWRMVRSVQAARKTVVIGRYMGGWLLRLALDALTLYAAWLLTRSLGGIVAAAAGLLAAGAASTLWQYRTLKRNT